jgi:site-specific DNA-methyltransferase (adenine-specific)
MTHIILREGDCLEILPKIKEKSIHAIITDLPYGTTQNKWDSIICLETMWREVKRILKPHGVFITTASQPFTSMLVTSNLNGFKYEWIWRKSHATGHLNSKVMPLRQHENILVFGDGRVTYNPQITRKPPADIRPSRRSKAHSDCYGAYRNDVETTIPLDMSYPRSIVEFNSPNHGEKGLHPTQKPTALYEYLIKTYTNEGDWTLDFCMGSGTTGVAAKKLNRNFVGIEKEENYFKIAEKRIQNAASNS